MFFDIEIINVDLFKSGAGKDCGGVWCPHGIDHDHTHIEDHHLSLRVCRIPNSNCPIGGSRDEGGRMVVIPSNFVDCEQMTFVGLLVLSRIGKRALMNFAFFGSDEEGKVIKLIEVEAETTGQTDEGSLFFLFASEF